MKINVKINEVQLGHFISCTMTLLFLCVLSSGLLFGQTGRTLNFVQDNGVHRIDQPGTYYTDCIVPQPGANPYLTLHVRGGDGGKVWIRNLFKQTVRTGQGGQGATVSGVFKIGTGANELKPGSKLRFIVGRGGDSHTNCIGCLGVYGGGGGGGTGVLYLPVGADETLPANWKILAVAGGGGGGTAGTGGFSRDGYRGQTTEYGYISKDFLNTFYSDGRTPVFGFGSNGAYDGAVVGGGGGTSFLTWHEAANGASWGNGVSAITTLDAMASPLELDETVYAGDGGNRLMGETMNLLSVEVGANNIGGKGLFQKVNGKILPIGGMGGTGDAFGGYGCGGGGGTRFAQGPYGEGSAGCGGGGYSGGWPGINTVHTDVKYPYQSLDLGGGGGGSYFNTQFTLTGSGLKTANGVTSNPGNGYVDYQFSATNPVVTQGLYLKADKGTQVEVLKTNGWTLKWQYDGNLVLYQTGVAKWASNTNNKGTALRFQGDGNLVIYQDGVAVWASNTANDEKGGKGGRYLVLTPEGSLFIIDQDGKEIWKGH